MHDTEPVRRRARAARDRVAGLLALSVAGLIGNAGLGAEDARTWRALGANAQGYSFSTGLSARTATAEEAIASLRTVCTDKRDGCPPVAVFDKGCRFVALGGKATAPNVLAPVFVVGSSAADAQRRCEALGLVCKREAQGGCVD